MAVAIDPAGHDIAAGRIYDPSRWGGQTLGKSNNPAVLDPDIGLHDLAGVYNCPASNDDVELFHLTIPIICFGQHCRNRIADSVARSIGGFEVLLSALGESIAEYCANLFRGQANSLDFFLGD